MNWHNIKGKIRYALILSSIFVLATTQKVKALQCGVKEIEIGTVYNQYDLDSDGIADTFKAAVTMGSKTAKKSIESTEETGTLRIYINNDVVFEQTRNGYPYWQLSLITLQNGRTFVDIESTVGSDDDCMHGLYALRNGQLESICDFQEPYSKYGNYYHVTITKVSGNYLIADAGAQFFTTGITHWTMKFQYMICKCQERHESFERTADSFKIRYKTMPVKNKWTAGKKLKAYKKAGSRKAVYTVKKGETVKINRVVFKKNKVYFQIKNRKGKTVYIPCASKYKYKQDFKEAMFAG
mgnify:CR=1 FL=1